MDPHNEPHNEPNDHRLKHTMNRTMNPTMNHTRIPRMNRILKHSMHNTLSRIPSRGITHP